MTETIALDSLVIPGSYVQVQAQGLIRAPAVTSGTIGIVGTADGGTDVTRLISSYAEAVAAFGNYDAIVDGVGMLNLVRSLEIVLRNGGGLVYARALDPGSTLADFEAAFAELAKEDIDIVVVPELSTADALSVLTPMLERGESSGREMLAVVGSDVDPNETAGFLQAITGSMVANDRIVMVTPGIETFDAAGGGKVMLRGTYAAPAVAALISSLAVQSSPTNQALAGVGELAFRYSYAEIQELVKARLCVLERRGGVRVVRGLTTDDGPFRRITTRRIVDYAKAGVREVSQPFIGRLNNQRVRAALQGAINGFLTSMLVDEALIDFKLSVTATRDDEIAGRAIVNVVMQPAFELEFVVATLVLE
jgi:hypothetical protein